MFLHPAILAFAAAVATAPVDGQPVAGLGDAPAIVAEQPEALTRSLTVIPVQADATAAPADAPAAPDVAATPAAPPAEAAPSAPVVAETPAAPPAEAGPAPAPAAPVVAETPVAPQPEAAAPAPAPAAPVIAQAPVPAAPPSPSRAIDILPAQPGAPASPTAPPADAVVPEPSPKITLKPEAAEAPAQPAPPAEPPAPAAAPVAPEAPSVVAETPNPAIEKAAIRQKAYLVGVWVYETAMPHGEPGRLRLVIRYKADGSFAGIAQFYERGVRSDVKIAGHWSLKPLGLNRFILAVNGADTGASITVDMLDSHRMLNLTNNVLMQRLSL